MEGRSEQVFQFSKWGPRLRGDDVSGHRLVDRSLFGFIIRYSKRDQLLIVPLVIFLFGQRYFVRGLLAGGVKG